jgi:hypothetical protein
MTSDQLYVTMAGVLLIVFVLWFFLGSEEEKAH